MNVLLVGDVMLGRLINETLRERPAAFPWGDTVALFRAADLRVCNLECAITNGGDPWAWPSKAFHFRTDEKNVESLLAAGIDLVSLANNHVLDFGEPGMVRTIDVLDSHGIGHAGAGTDRDEAETAAIRLVDSVRVGLVAFTDNEPSWAAGRFTAGTFYLEVDGEAAGTGEVLLVVRAARSNVDLLIVSAHWGPNWGEEPPPGHVQFGHALIDAGADIVFGHSGHVVRGVGVYRHRPILYCAGDFVDDYAVDPIARNDFSAIFTVHTDGSRVSGVTIQPTVIRDFQACRAGAREAEAILRRLQRLCARLGTATTIDEDRLELTIPMSSVRTA